MATALITLRGTIFPLPGVEHNTEMHASTALSITSIAVCQHFFFNPLGLVVSIHRSFYCHAHYCMCYQRTKFLFSIKQLYNNTRISSDLIKCSNVH